MVKRVKVLLSKIGLDAHDRGLANVALALKDAGMEVLYLGRHQFPEQIALVAAQEDPDIIGISSLAGAHMGLMPRLIEELKERGVEAPVILGGFIQPEDIPMLRKMGVAEVFEIGTRLDDVVKWIAQNVQAADDQKMC